MRLKMLFLLLLVAVLLAASVGWLIHGFTGKSGSLSPEEKYARLSDKEKQQIVDRVSELLNLPENPKVAGFVYTAEGFEIHFTGKADPQTITKVREVIGDLPLKILENVICETIPCPTIAPEKES